MIDDNKLIKKTERKSRNFTVADSHCNCTANSIWHLHIKVIGIHIAIGIFRGNVEHYNILYGIKGIMIFLIPNKKI